MATSTYEIVQIRLWPVARYGALPIEQFLDQMSVCEHNGRAGTKLEREHAAVLLCPFCESGKI